MKTHDLKIWPIYFEAVKSGTKTFEFRANDRDFKLGDKLRLNEYDPEKRLHTGHSILALVTYLFTSDDEYFLNGERTGIAEGFCIMGIRII